MGHMLTFFISVVLTWLNSPSESLMRQRKRSGFIRSCRYHLDCWVCGSGTSRKDGKWPVCICLALSQSLARLPRPFPQYKLSQPLRPSAHGVSRKATQLRRLPTYCAWSMVLSRQAAGVHPEVSDSICSGLPNWLGLLRQIGRTHHVKLFRASCLSVIQYFWHGLLTLVCRGGGEENALCMRESVTKCVKVIWGFLIALTSNFKCPAHVPRLRMSKHTWQFLHLREGKLGPPRNALIAVSVDQIHIYKRQPGDILCPQQAVQSSKLNSATQLSLTECWISERICILEKCMTGGRHTH